MTGIAAGLTGFAVLLALMAIRIPIAVSMLATGVVGYGLVNGWSPLLAYLKTNTYYQFSTYSLSVIPLLSDVPLAVTLTVLAPSEENWSIISV